MVAEGDGLKATETVKVNVIQPRLDLEFTGPKLRYKDRKGTFVIKLTNPGDAPATNVYVGHAIPEGFKFVSADNGGQHDFATRTVKWFVGEVKPGDSTEVKVELVATGLGDFTHKAAAMAARGIRAEKTLATKVEGLSAIMMEVVDTEDPVEVNSPTSYEIRVTNTGSKTEEDLKMVCVIPAQLKFKSATGPTKFDVVGNEVVFQPLGKLAAKADVTYKLVVTAVAAGDARFKATLTTATLTTPVVKEEATRVYGD